MLGHTRKHLTEINPPIFCMHYAGISYEFPAKVAEKYRVTKKTLTEEDIFGELNKKYTKAGSIFGGLRFREGLTQVQMAKKLKVTQSDISQMENGKRKIGPTIAKRIKKLFDVDFEAILSAPK